MVDGLCATLTSALRRSWLSSGRGTRISVPSTAGVSPSGAMRIAFSTALTMPRSQTCTDSMRGSGTLIVPTWFSGSSLP